MFLFLLCRKKHPSNTLIQDQSTVGLFQRLHNTICKPKQENGNKTVKGKLSSLHGLNARFWILKKSTSPLFKLPIQSVKFKVNCSRLSNKSALCVYCFWENVCLPCALFLDTVRLLFSRKCLPCALFLDTVRLSIFSKNPGRFFFRVFQIFSVICVILGKQSWCTQQEMCT